MSKKKSSQPLAAELKPYVAPFCFDGSGEFHLKSHKTNEKGGLDKDKGEKIIEANRKRLNDYQAKLYAQNQWSLLLIFQGMDASGKDSAIKSVFDGVNPQGCQVYSFKSPNSEELDHDFLWRVQRDLPERGRIGIWNRSHYEEVLVVRVNPSYLDVQKLPHRPRDLEDLWLERYESIVAAEKHWARNGCVILKFFLNVSQKEQHKRFLERVSDPEHYWKFNSTDMSESKKWDQYMDAYQDALAATSKPWAPWYAIPADSKHYMRRAVAEIVVSTLKQLPIEYPTLPDHEIAELARVKSELESE
jgi:PPK2 family polyphosphate:nucleotide phosphotransferase